MTAERHVTELLPAYALGCLDEGETAMVAEHLATCPACRAELAAYQGVADQLALAAPDAAPSPALKQRLMTRVQAPPAAGSSMTPASWWQKLSRLVQPARPALGLGALLLIVVLGVGNVLLWRQLDQLRQSPPDVLRTVDLTGADAASDALGKIVVSMDERHGVLAVDGLPVLDETQQYQLWLIDSAGQRTSGALFSVDEDGYGSAVIEAPQPLLSYAAFGVTIEPAGGSPGPTGDKVLGGEL